MKEEGRSGLLFKILQPHTDGWGNKGKHKNKSKQTMKRTTSPGRRVSDLEPNSEVWIQIYI